MGRIKRILHNPIKCCIVFPNETCRETYTDRQSILQGKEDNIIRTPEPLEDWLRRSLQKTANWYYNHLSTSVTNPPRIKIVYGDIKENCNKISSNGVEEISIEEYVNKLEDKEILLLLESLKDVRENFNENQIEKNNQDGEFTEHLTNEALEAGIKSAILFKGKLQVNKYNTTEGFVQVSNSVQFDEIFISNLNFRNRGIHGDIVAVELLPKSQWTTPKRSITKEKKPDESSIVDASGDSNDEESGLSSKDDKIPCGRIVGIINRIGRLYAATVQPSANNDGRKLIVVPMDVRIPKIRITTRQSSDLKDKRLSVRIDDWQRNSQYPNGHYVSILGKIGDIDTETKGKNFFCISCLARKFRQVFSKFKISSF